MGQCPEGLDRLRVDRLEEPNHGIERPPRILSSGMSSQPAWVNRFRVAIKSWTQLRASRFAACRAVMHYLR